MANKQSKRGGLDGLVIGRSAQAMSAARRGGAGAGSHGDRRLKRQKTRSTQLRAALRD